MKNREIKELNEIFKYLENDNKDKPSEYLVNCYKLMKDVEFELEAIKQVEPKLQKQYQKEEADLYLKYSQKDKNGNYILKQGKSFNVDGTVKLDYLELSNQEAFGEELSQLKNTYDWDKINDEINKYNEFLEEESNFEIKHKLKAYDGMNQKAYNRFVDIGVIEL